VRSHFYFERFFMKKKLELYYFPQCPYCQVVLSAIRTTGLDHEVKLLDIHDEPHNREKLVNDTGRGTVPCLYIDDRPMHESKDIANWLHKYANEIQSDSPGAISGS
jgi:glutaredoxin 3